MDKYIIGKMRVKAGTRDELLAAAAPFMVSTRAEAGCIFFEMAVSAVDPDAVVVVERFASAEAHDLHDKSAHMAEFRVTLNRLLVDTYFEFILSDNIVNNGGSLHRPIT